MVLVFAMAALDRFVAPLVAPRTVRVWKEVVAVAVGSTVNALMSRSRSRELGRPHLRVRSSTVNASQCHNSCGDALIN